MDDPNNPASPFMAREEVEDAAGELAGMSQEEIDANRTAAPEPTDLADAEPVRISREEGLDLLCQGLLQQIREAAQQLKAAREQNFWGDVQEVEKNLAMLLPENQQSE